MKARHETMRNGMISSMSHKNAVSLRSLLVGWSAGTEADKVWHGRMVPGRCVGGTAGRYALSGTHGERLQALGREVSAV